MTCAWRSTKCDILHPTELYEVEVGTPGSRRKVELALCTFHGQAWPKVGEDAEEAAKRTKRVHIALTSSSNYGERKRRNAARRSAGTED